MRNIIIYLIIICKSKYKVEYKINDYSYPFYILFN